MGLKDKLNEDYIYSYKQRDVQKVAILRLVLSAIKNSEIEAKKPLEDNDIIKVLKKEIKQRQETIEGLNKAGRDSEVVQEETTISLLKNYLPAELSEDEIKRIVKEAVIEVGATDIKDLGKTIALAMKKAAGKADGSVVSRIAKEELSS